MSIAGSSGAIEDSFVLSPVQQGMLFHHLKGANSGVDVEQIVVEYPEAIDEAAMREAWQTEVSRQPVLRTAFLWQDVADPVQEIHRAVELEFSLRPCASDEAFEAYLAEDRRRGFNLKEPPLLRIALFHLGPERCRMVWTFHHILIDGRSFVAILQAVDRLYDRIRRGETAPPAPVAVEEYKSFIEGLQHRDRAAAKDFWRAQLSGFTAPTPLPVDLDARPEEAAARYGEQEQRLTAETSDRLRLLADETGVTLNTVLMGAWAILLSRYSGESDIVFGATKTGRRGIGAVGLFLNTVPVRVNAARERTVSAALQDLRRQWVDLRPYEYTPLVEIKEASELPAASPLFDSLVVFENQRFDTVLAGLGGPWPARRCRLLEQTNYTLSFLAYGDREILLKLEYDARRYTRPAIARVLGHVERILEEMAANPQLPLGKIGMLRDEERRQILVEWNRTEAEYPRDVLVPEAISRQAAATPENTALVFHAERSTYRELNRRANQVARHLAAMGAGPGTLVGVHVERSREMLVALLGVMKSGAGYVPLDPGFPPERLTFMAEDAALRVAITQEGASSLPAGIPQVLIDADWPAISAHSADDFPCPAGADQIAYVLYTSGSTGKPKGVRITHRALANFVYSMAREPGMSARDVLLAVTTISFDIAGLELYLPLMTGATLVLAAKEAVWDPQSLGRLLDEHAVTVMQATPATWQMLFDNGWAGKRDLKVLCGGEALSRDLATRLLGAAGELWNMYGPTETTIWSLVRRITAADRTILIGRAIANTTVYILDDDRNPAPVGVAGELYIGGEGVSAGYLNRPDHTRDRFLPDPFAPGRGNIYRTGDLARYWPNGDVECLGRNDFQVKIRGFRIELGEIEAALQEHPEVRQAVASVYKDPQGARLVAYLIPRDSQRPTTPDLRTFLAKRLPDYMVPGQFLFLERFPLTPNGKVNRLGLPAPDAAPAVESAYVAPRDEFEEMVSKAWAEVLGLPRIGIHDNFFDLGGHSLLAVRLIVHLQKIIPGEPILLAALLESPTVERFAAWLRNRGSSQFRYLVRMREGAGRPPFFCVHGAGGNVLSMRALAMTLPASLPFYCLQARGLDGSEPFPSVEETARCYVDEVRSVQPHGPYYIGGGCYGGVVAFEMARIFEAQGERVAALVMMDSYNFNFGKFLSPPRLAYCNARFIVKRFLAHARKMAAESPGEWGDSVGRPLRTMGKLVWELARTAVGLKSSRVTIDPNIVEIEGADGTQLGVVLKRVRRASLTAAAKFIPQKFGGKAVLFIAKERHREPFEDPYLGWGPVVGGGIDAFILDGDHDSIFDAHVRQLAGLMDAKLLEAQANGSSAPTA